RESGSLRCVPIFAATDQSLAKSNAARLSFDFLAERPRFVVTLAKIGAHFFGVAEIVRDDCIHIIQPELAELLNDLLRRSAGIVRLDDLIERDPCATPADGSALVAFERNRFAELGADGDHGYESTVALTWAPVEWCASTRTAAAGSPPSRRRVNLSGRRS